MVKEQAKMIKDINWQRENLNIAMKRAICEKIMQYHKPGISRSAKYELCEWLMKELDLEEIKWKQ